MGTTPVPFCAPLLLKNPTPISSKKFFDMSSVYGAHAEIVSFKTDANGLEICCGLWSTRKEKNTLAWAKMFTGASEPVLIQQAA